MNTDHTILKSKKHISSIKEDKISTNYIVHFEKGSYVTKKGQMRIETLTVYEGKKNGYASIHVMLMSLCS